MDIVSRLKSFLKMNEISNSQFADKCEIPRPTISQLLKGRNKKVSDEVIAKIHLAYPELSMMWLMFGEGPITTDIGKNRNSTLNSNPSLFNENDVDSSSASTLSENQNVTEERTRDRIVFGDDSFPEETHEPIRTSQSSVAQAMANIAKTVGAHSVNGNNSGSNSKKIVSIMVFYSDNSFETFEPK